MQLSPEIHEKLKIYEALLKKWQKAVNLVAPSTLESAWERHFEDSLQLLPLLSEKHAVVADLGSGAGFAGLVTAICAPEREIHLIESDQKKCSFLKTVSRETGCQNVHIHNERVENTLDELSPNLITARAFASLRDIFEYISPLLPDEELEMLLHKGRSVQEEVSEASKKYDFQTRLHQSTIEQDSYIVHVTSIARG